ncbi:hypothetical protein NLU13_2142 [Sarocladium strictum]|uniref:RED-like N-terminal domain-containing protein n=1 Tax=Sarocladium strictum TaxID=5046 RepID=A0AA39GSA9_SARSR|nr:hypothetical protein NLU13_2142 [Sarocladium strictum]
MNNEQFRRLVSGSSSGKGTSPKDGSPPTAQSPKSASALGSRQRSAIPMTPRSVAGAQANFARQIAERNQASRSQKTFKTSAPRGVKLGSGYVDRAKERGDEEADDREERLKALEKSLKEEEIDQVTYERLRFQIAGGDLSSTHLVKGLDFKLVKRIREGEDVYGEKKTEAEAEDPEKPDEGVDDEFDKLEHQTVQAVERRKEEKKKGQLSTVSLAPGKKRTRDQILADLKAARRAAREQQESTLGQGFKKIGAKQMPGTRIERDSKGREVMIIVDEDGHEKRKVRKVQPDEVKSELLMPDASAKPLGMEVPEQYRNKVEEPEEDEDVDIFDDVGDDYDPLAGMDAASDDDSDAEKPDEKQPEPNQPSHDIQQPSTKEMAERAAMPPPPKPVQAAPRNYFSNSKTKLISEEADTTPSMSDPAIMAAIKRAAALNPIGRGDDEGSSDEEERDKEKALEERRRRLLEASSRDDEDIDMGFGTSRFEDEEDFDDSKVKLSAWGKDGDDDQERGAKAKRKRGAKKRKGDANNADDVLRVMEQRKKSS